MKAAIYHGKENVTIEERSVPSRGPRDVLLKTVYASVCGTDAAVYRHGPGTGHRITVGSEFGHEAVCRVAEVGAEVTDFHVGQRVYPYPLLVTGDTSRAGTMGAFSEYILARDGNYDITSIITHEFPHSELAKALELAGQPDEALNVVIRFENEQGAEIK